MTKIKHPASEDNCLNCAKYRKRNARLRKALCKERDRSYAYRIFEHEYPNTFAKMNEMTPSFFFPHLEYEPVDEGEIDDIEELENRLSKNKSRKNKKVLEEVPQPESNTTSYAPLALNPEAKENEH